MRKGTAMMAAAVLLASVTAAACGQEQKAVSIAPLTLSDAIASALAASSTTRVSDAVRHAANLLARAQNLPRTGFVTIVRAEPEAGSPPRYTAAEQYTVDMGSAVGRTGAVRAAQAELAQAAATLATTRRASVSAVLGAFFALGSDEAQALMQADNVSLATRTMMAAVERHRVGIAPALDVERARAQLATVHAEQAATTAALAGDEVALAELVGYDTPRIAMPTLPPALPDLAAVSDAAARTSPTVLAAQATLASSEAGVLLARAQTRPGLSIGAGIGVTRQAGEQNVGPAADVSFTVPIGTGFTKANVAVAEAAASVSKAALEQARREAAQSALRAWTTANSAMARLPGLRTASDSARRVVEADIAGYRLGAVSSADLTAAQTQAAAARAALQTATIQALQAYAQLQFEMGALE